MEFTQEEINNYILNEFGIENPNTTFAEICFEIEFLTENVMTDDWLIKYPLVYCM